MLACLLVITGNLRLMRDVGLHRSVSKAAKINGLSQSAASQAVQELERELGVILFDRTRRPLEVTPAGKLYLDFCKDVLRRSDEFEGSLARLKGELAGTVRIAAIYSVGLSEMAEIEAKFSARFPEAELNVQYLRPERVYEAVERDDADLGMVSYPESTREIVALPWREEEMVVAVAPDHRLAGRKSVEAGELDGEEFIGFDEDLPIQSHINRYFREQRVEVQPTLHFDNLQMIKEAVAHGAGVSIMPRRVMREDLEQGRLRAIALSPAELYRPVGIIHRRRKLFNEAARALLNFLRDEQTGLAA